MSYLPVTGFIQHLARIRTAYSVHSPFVFDFHQLVLRGSPSEIGQEIENLRRDLSHSREQISFQDLGAGMNGKTGHVNTTIGKLAQKASRKRKEGELLRRLISHYQPESALELGTHLGISTLYQLSGMKTGRLISVEGIEALSMKAASHISRFGFEAELMVGEFESVLTSNINLESLKPDYVFIDGNHRYEATISYFETFLPHMKEGGIMVFDDIYWSEGMNQAWKEIISHPEVRVSIDLFQMGIIFLRRNQAKEHFHFWL